MEQIVSIVKLRQEATGCFVILSVLSAISFELLHPFAKDSASQNARCIMHLLLLMYGRSANKKHHNHAYASKLARILVAFFAVRN